LGAAWPVARIHKVDLMDFLPEAVLGLDVSKAKVDCALLVNGKIRSKAVANRPEGFAELSKWLTKQGVERAHACCEATGTYSDALATYLADAGHVVSIVNPARIAAYAQVQLSRAKTDRMDARLIAQFCARERPPAWVPAPAAERLLLALVRDLQAVQTMRTMEANRLPTAHASVQPRIERHIVFLDAEIERLQAAIRDHIDHQDDLRGRRDLLDSIPGLGEATIAWLLAYLGDGARFTASKQASAFAGLVPKLRESGSSMRGKAAIAKSGHADLRHALYMPAVVAYSRCKAYAPFVQRLKANGKPPKLIIVALMRKLITIAHAILKSGKRFDPSIHSA
jgi:transposase